MNNNRSLLTLLLICTFGLYVASPALADELIMKNGDRMTGTVEKKDGENIFFKTSYGGPFQISWSEVEEVRTDEPMTVLYSGGAVEEKSVVSQTTPEDEKKLKPAYINPEDWRLGEGYRFSGLFNFGLQVQRGNTDSDELDVSSNLELRSVRNRYKFFGEYERDESNDVKTTDKRFLQGDYNRFLNKRTYIGANVANESDEFADLDDRSSAGPVVGYQFYEGEMMNLLGQVGSSYVWEDFKTADSEEYWSGTWRVEFDMYAFDKAIQPYHRHEGLVSFEDSEKYLLKAWFGIRVPLVLGLVGSTEVKFDYDNAPADDADRLDSTYNILLGYQW